LGSPLRSSFFPRESFSKTASAIQVFREIFPGRLSHARSIAVQTRRSRRKLCRARSPLFITRIPELGATLAPRVKNF
jgi:hypothetical protein